MAQGPTVNQAGWSRCELLRKREKENHEIHDQRQRTTRAMDLARTGEFISRQVNWKINHHVRPTCYQLRRGDSRKREEKSNGRLKEE